MFILVYMSCCWMTWITSEVHMNKMFNPPHPGEVLKEYLGDVSVTQAHSNLGVQLAVA